MRCSVNFYKKHIVSDKLINSYRTQRLEYRQIKGSIMTQKKVILPGKDREGVKEM